MQYLPLLICLLLTDFWTRFSGPASKFNANQRLFLACYSPIFFRCLTKKPDTIFDSLHELTLLAQISSPCFSCYFGAGALTVRPIASEMSISPSIFQYVYLCALISICCLHSSPRSASLCSHRLASSQFTHAWWQDGGVFLKLAEPVHTSAWSPSYTLRLGSCTTLCPVGIFTLIAQLKKSSKTDYSRCKSWSKFYMLLPSLFCCYSIEC